MFESLRRPPEGCVRIPKGMRLYEANEPSREFSQPGHALFLRDDFEKQMGQRLGHIPTGVRLPPAVTVHYVRGGVHKSRRAFTEDPTRYFAEVAERLDPDSDYNNPLRNATIGVKTKAHERVASGLTRQFLRRHSSLFQDQGLSPHFLYGSRGYEYHMAAARGASPEFLAARSVIRDFSRRCRTARQFVVRDVYESILRHLVEVDPEAGLEDLDPVLMKGSLRLSDYRDVVKTYRAEAKKLEPEVHSVPAAEFARRKRVATIEGVRSKYESLYGRRDFDDYVFPVLYEKLERGQGSLDARDLPPTRSQVAVMIVDWHIGKDPALVRSLKDRKQLIDKVSAQLQKCGLKDWDKRDYGLSRRKETVQPAEGSAFRPGELAIPKSPDTEAGPGGPLPGPYPMGGGGPDIFVTDRREWFPLE